MSSSSADASSPGLVLVIGTGLIGGSIGLALRRAGVDVLLEDLDASSLTSAEAMGAGRVSDAIPDLVVVAVPPSAAAGVMIEAANRFPLATITDVTSVKAPIVDQVRAAGIDTLRIVGGHPMAGRETMGVNSARSDLFDDRMWIVTPSTNSDSVHVKRVRDLALTCGAYPLEMTPQDHDSAVALISHVPQVLASALAGQLQVAPEEHVVIAGQGLRDMTRIASSDSALWADILTTNSENVRLVLSGVITSLQGLHDDLGTEDSPDAVLNFLELGGVGRSRIPGKHGAANHDFSQILVQIADKPGELARLFTAVGDVDVNLEDVRIEHVLGKPSGIVGLYVSAQSAPVLTLGLIDKGFDVR